MTKTIDKRGFKVLTLQFELTLLFMAKKVSGIRKMTPSQQPFSKLNYLLMGGCCLLIIIGFLLMLGGGSSVEGGFNPDIFSTRRIVVGPALAFLGFLLMAFAILIDPGKSKKKETVKDKSEDGVA